jgi:antirestriction protein
MKAWIGNLADYNNGRLTGEWVLISPRDPADTAREITRICGDAEHYVADYDGISRALIAKLGEYAGADQLHTAAALMTAMRDATPDAVDVDDMLDCYLDAEGYGKTLEALAEGAEDWVSDNFQGVFDTLTHWAESYIEDTGMLNGADELLARYFDYEAFGRDAQLGGDIRTSRTDRGLLVFSA